MSLDNVLAVAGAAHGDLSLIAIELAITIPIIIAGSRLILFLISKFPLIVWLGSAVIVVTGAQMVLNDERLGLRNYLDNSWLVTAFYLEPIPKTS